jgi:hypothetical protein
MSEMGHTFWKREREAVWVSETFSLIMAAVMPEPSPWDLMASSRSSATRVSTFLASTASICSRNSFIALSVSAATESAELEASMSSRRWRGRECVRMESRRGS